MKTIKELKVAKDALFAAGEASFEANRGPKEVRKIHRIADQVLDMIIELEREHDKANFVKPKESDLDFLDDLGDK